MHTEAGAEGSVSQGLEDDQGQQKTHCVKGRMLRKRTRGEARQTSRAMPWKPWEKLAHRSSAMATQGTQRGSHVGMPQRQLGMDLKLWRQMWATTDIHFHI